MTSTDVVIEIVGWAGASLILLAYLLLSAGKLTGQSLAYQWMNVIGAAGFIVNGWWHGALPSAVLNVIWMLIGTVAVWRILDRRRVLNAPDQGPPAVQGRAELDPPRSEAGGRDRRKRQV
jgi:hypothetical protein